ncbi:flagellar biosynthesis protein FlgN [Campylobacter gastrosuis]|uniref:Flagellar biosynthesis protein FlgN n=1 Tax=Campylobacter gastrosuis TaxID=2974576 RepID=A0ABT7HN71_9BACT|nr:flagellar biosynthesis protein FlgN [Campylobacter gastrosuis]MDL0088366.1 flagellar biosynthesis protein FlgN [Campylobacter gastrosuis]
MLKRYLNTAISILDELIDTTLQDIENIKEAKHSAVDESVRKKGVLVKNFEDTKRSLDKELVNLSKTSENLQEALDDEVKANLVLMREKLEILHKVNKEYARHVVLVKEFFDSLTKQMFNLDQNAYTQSVSQSNFYKAKV